MVKRAAVVYCRRREQKEGAVVRIFDAEPQVIEDFKYESEPITAKETPTFKVFAVRHPTLGKVVIVERKDGSGVIVETEG
jgi:hypothetical protein